MKFCDQNSRKSNISDGKREINTAQATESIKLLGNGLRHHNSLFRPQPINAIS